MAGTATIFGSIIAAVFILPLLVTMVVSVFAIGTSTHYGAKYEKRQSAIEKELPGFKDVSSDLIPEVTTAEEAGELLAQGCDQRTMADDINRALENGVSPDEVAFPQDAAGVERYCSARTMTLEMAKGYAEDNDKLEKRTKTMGGIIAVLTMIAVFGTPIGLAVWRRRMRNRRLAVEQDNERGLDLWESRMEERKREFEVRNAQAREQAFQRFQQILGVRLDDNLGTVWADTNTRNVARVLSSTINNELKRPPVVQELPEIGPLRLNGAVPQDLRDVLSRRG